MDYREFEIGGLALKIPVYHEEYLDVLYGKDWRTPANFYRV